MDFVSSSFPGTRVHIQLYQVKGKNENVTADELNQRRQGLAALATTYQDNLAVVDAKFVASIMHLNIAVSRALISKRDRKMKTASLGNEVIYFMHPQHSIQASISKYGVKNCQDACFAIFIDFPPSQVQVVSNEFRRFTQGALDDLNQHLEFQDVNGITGIFDLKEKEKTLPGNCLLTSIYTKLALKNI